MDLFEDVDPTRTRVSIEPDGDVAFECVKVTPKMWPRLRAVGSVDAIARRREAADREAAAAAADADARAEASERAIARTFLERQWAIEDALYVASSSSSEGSSEARARASPPATSPTRRPARAGRPPAPRARPPPRERVDVLVDLTPRDVLPARETAL